MNIIEQPKLDIFYLLYSRPVTACWCAYLPRNRVSPKTTVYVLQHPYEVCLCMLTLRHLYYDILLSLKKIMNDLSRKEN